MASYQVLVVGLNGVPYSEIGNATIQSITWELNGWGEATLTMPVTDAQAWSEFRPAYQCEEEVQIWRNGRLIWWGIYVAGTADEQTLTITCYGLLWYFSRRYFGPVHSNAMPQQLINGTFDNASVLTGWSATAGITTSASTSRRRTGNQSIKLVTTGSGVTDYYIIQGVSVPTPARIKPLTYTATAWQYRETVTTRDNWDRGLVLAPFVGGVGQDPEIDSLAKPDEELGRWVRREASLTLPAGAGNSVGVVLYAPANGTVYWDDVVLTYQQRTGAVEGEDWSDDYLRRIFNYGAGNSNGGSTGPGGSLGDQKSWWGAPVLKSLLNMTFTGSGVAVGALRADLYWDHADEGNIFSAMSELPARNILDFEITWAPNGRSRAITAWGPRKGITKLGLAAEQGRNIVTFRYDVDGRRRATDVRVVGRATGKVKEEGQAGGPTVPSGWQYESIISPPFEIAGQALIDQAIAEEARLGEPVRTPTITVEAGMYMGDTIAGTGAESGAPLEVGDTIPVRISHGWIVEAANRRVVKMTLKPETETLELTFNDG